MMERYTVIFSPMAIEDIKQAIIYYEGVKEGLGEHFNSQLRITLNAIRRNALFASVRYDDIRCAAIKKFPYMVHYHVDETKEVIIVAVYSTYKQPLWE